MVSDLSCSICGSLLGWKYVEASEESQRYKVGKFILETKKIRVGVRWDNERGTAFGSEIGMGMDGYDGMGPSFSSEREKAAGVDGKGGPEGVDEELEFDSQDEDECEDLFAGVWSSGLAKRRRQRKNERFRRKAGKVFVPRVNGSQDSLGG